MIKGARIAIIGFGNMGRALAQGFLDNGLKAGRIHAVDPNKDALAAAEEMGIDFSESIRGLTHPPSVVLLAVKPQLMADVLPVFEAFCGETTFFLSIAAGVKIATLQKHLGNDARIVRAMPNTPAAIGRGMTVLCHSDNLAFQQLALAETLMGCVGACEWVDDEHLLDAVTAISGSGPAYFYLLIEALAKAGVAHGLGEELALTLATETCYGAGALAAHNLGKKTAEELRREVMSKGGTTEAAVNSLQGSEFQASVRAAVDAAVTRSKELG